MIAARERSARAASAAAVALLTVLAPIQSTIWHGPAAPDWISSLPWVAPALRIASEFAVGLPTYDIFGRLTIIAYALLLFGLTRMVPLFPPPKAGIAWRVAIASFAIAATADIVAYWIAGLEGVRLRSMAFWGVEVPALVMTTLALATAGLFAARQPGVNSRDHLWLVATPVLALAATLVVQYMPHGPLIGIAMALTIVFRR